MIERWDSVMPKTTSDLLSRSCVRPWLCRSAISMPTFFRAVTEFSEMASPVWAATPAEMTFRLRSGSGCADRAWARRPCAIGLRQMLPVQTMRMWPGADISEDRRQAAEDRQGRGDDVR